MKTATVTYAPNGAEPHEVPVNEINVPDLWNIAMSFEGPTRDMIVDAWHLAHDLLTHAQALHEEANMCNGCGHQYEECECVPEKDFPDEHDISNTEHSQRYLAEVEEDELRALFYRGGSE